MAGKGHNTEQLLLGIQQMLDQHFEKLENFFDKRLQSPQQQLRHMQEEEHADDTLSWADKVSNGELRADKAHSRWAQEVGNGELRAATTPSSRMVRAATASTISRMAMKRSESFHTTVSENRISTVNVNDFSRKVRQQLCYGIKCPSLSFVNNTWCEMTIGFCILANTILFGAEVEYLASTLSVDTHDVFKIVSHCFFAIFLAELIVRILLDSYDFFVLSDHLAWNYFDLLLVAFSTLEFIFVLTGSDKAVGGNLLFMRVFRMLKMVRLLRVVRFMRFFRPLRVLVHSIINTVKSLTWTVSLLFVILYLFGVLFTQASTQYFINDYCKENPPCPATETTIQDTPLYYYFGSIAKSIFTLFKSLTGGVSWQEIAQPLEDVSLFWAVFFAGFISFCYLAVLNIITGIVCTAAIESATEDLDMQVQATVAEKEKYAKQLVGLFEDFDVDQSGQISFDEIQQVLQADPQGVAAVFQAMQISVETAWELFQLLDTDGDQRVGLEEFVEGCIRLRGNAKASDIHLLMHESKVTCSSLVALNKYFEGDFLLDVQEQLAQVLAKQGWVSPSTGCSRV